MKHLVSICLLPPLFLLGCSKKPSEAERRANIQALPTLPFQITVVETPESAEISDISNSVVSLLAAKDYNKLDEVAAQYRSSKEGYADGRWKLIYVFEGLIPSENISDSEWEARLADIRSWVKAKPNSITAQLALANDMVAYAWKPGLASSKHPLTSPEYGLGPPEHSLALEKHCPRSSEHGLGPSEHIPALREHRLALAKPALELSDQFNDTPRRT